ncbi:hypothetical protein GVX82_02400 [Patescibacteria group bacterium]|jgi:peptidoglycan hydrolase-like protein with peptidoglycan-binding domain|nr:hypothetical protein [Patescibacteria group bacterium]
MFAFRISLTTLAALCMAATYFLLAVQPAYALVDCDFSRDLEYGIDGEDVRCLQRYLNDAGFTVAESGPGAPGSETSLFRDATEEAVIAWQEANNVYPASGYFGPLSREKYRTLVNLGVSSIDEALAQEQGSDDAGTGAEASSTDEPLPTLPSDLANLPTLGADEESGEDVADEVDALGLSPEVAALMRSMMGDDEPDPAPARSSVDETEVRELLLAAVRAIEDAGEQIEEREVGGDDRVRALGNYEDARDDLFGAVRAFLTSDLDEALDLADDAHDNARDAFEDAGGDDPETEANDELDELEEELADARERVEEADDDGDEVDLSERFLDDADELLAGADDRIDDEEFGEALDVLDEAEEAIEEAIDSIGLDERESDDAYRDLEGEIEEAREEFDDVWDELEEAIADNEQTGNAEEILLDADDVLDAARETLEDGEYDDAHKLVDEALEMIEEAHDEL